MAKIKNTPLLTGRTRKSRIQLHAEQGTVWLSQLEISELFNATKQNISRISFYYYHHEIPIAHSRITHHPSSS
ncbi:hypothetical protein BSZ32_07770 [Rubritalea profundi]|uniref:Death-on-curing protein n=1 Tax=Rubritalea profundi TaxID=1658618 RepID=A0A2S7U1P2_9BACT|nr:hypothetical protein BSZ32_07770 [Rubritalea profundi]